VVRDLGSGSLLSTIGRLQFPALIRGPFAQGPDQRRLDARDVFAHQHLRAPGLLREDRLWTRGEIEANVKSTPLVQ
jgi:hypothetical protein